jgi:bifunctional non-homologous end joining protein LigD
MLATAGPLPMPPVGWATELKWDGVRAVAYLDAGGCRLLSRNDRDISGSYPEFAELPAALGVRSAVLDGEIVAMDANARPDFGLLQSRMHVVDPGKARILASRTPVRFLVFDVLEIDGTATMSLPYVDRRGLLRELEIGADHVDVPPSFDDDPTTVFAASLQQGLEGVVCKRLDSIYTPGRRSPAWIKAKHLRMQEVVVIGWEPGQGRRDRAIGALLLGVHIDGELRYVGQVGTGFTDQMLVDLRIRLSPMETSASPVSVMPPEHARTTVWVRPELVGEVSYSQWTRDQRLRHPSWRGLRPDKAASDVEMDVELDITRE